MFKRILALAFAAGLLVGCSSTNSTAEATTKHQDSNSQSEKLTKTGKPLDVDAIIKKMKNRDIKCGQNEDNGVWVVCKVIVSADAKLPPDQMLAMAEIRAKRDIAQWMNSSVSSESTLEKSQTIEGDQNTIKEFYHSLTKVNSEAFLRGVTLFTYQKDNDGLVAYYYCTGKNTDRAAELEKQLKEAPPGVVRAVGFGCIVSGNVSDAKKQAMQTALRNAVEQVMGTTVIGQSQLMDNEKAKSKMLSQTTGTVKHYRIVKEDKDGTSYQVILNAEVDEQSLLDNYAEMVRSMGNPPFMIQTQDPDLKTALTDFFAGLGFMVTENSNAAQFIVKADCKYLPVTDDYYGKGIQIDVGLTLYDVKTQQQLISLRNSPQLTSTYSGSFHLIRQSAAKKAFKTMKKNLHEKLNKIVMDWVLNGHDVQVIFENVPSSDLGNVLVQAMDFIPCAKYKTHTLSGNTLTMTCSYVGPSADFEGFIKERLKKDLPEGVSVPQTKKIDLSEITFKF